MENMEKYSSQIADVKKQVQKVVFGKDEVIDKILMAIMGSGHVLIDDIPGVGKTTMANAFSKALGLNQKRLTFTPDVLPSDIIGFSMYNKDLGTFEYHSGAIMCNLFLADEINRTSPKTQSALLEVMEEGRVTIDGETRTIPQPFVVIATENPVGSIGTQKLPESQLDRFMIRTSMGYPSMEAEAKIIMGKKNNLMDTVKNVLRVEDLLEIRNQVKQVYMEESVCLYIAQLSNASRIHESVALGISPRGSVAISGMARACAFMDGRSYVTPDDVKAVLPETMVHRLVLNARAKVNKVTEADVIAEVMQSVKVPELKIRA